MGKIIAAGLVGVVVVFVAWAMGHMIYDGEPRQKFDKHMQKVDVRGYVHGGTIQVAEAEEDLPPFELAAALATADIEKGAKKAKKCAACHSWTSGGKNGVGPNLYGVVGADVANVSSFSYSDAMKAKGGKWTAEELFAFLSNPKQAVPGTKMAFAGFKKPVDAANVIGFLNTLSDNPVDLGAK